MNLTNLKIFILVLLLSEASCGGVNSSDENGTEPQIKYQESMVAWEALKQEHGDSYQYTAEVISWTGDGSRTTIQVRNGKPFSRYYEAFQISEEDGKRIITEIFEESGIDLGADDRGAKAFTVEELYETCASDYLRMDQEENQIYLETFDNKIISLCGFVPRNCQDDCFIGFTLTDFKWL